MGSQNFDLKNIIRKELIFVNKNEKSRDTLLQTLSTRLEEYEYVKEDYYDAIIERENNFPTGLVTKSVNVAIPHADAEYVNKSAISIALLADPVEFKRMDESSKDVGVEIVFMLAIKEKENQAELIKNLISIFQDPVLLPEIKNSESSEEVEEKLLNYLKN